MVYDNKEKKSDIVTEKIYKKAKSLFADALLCIDMSDVLTKGHLTDEDVQASIRATEKSKKITASRVADKEIDNTRNTIFKNITVGNDEIQARLALVDIDSSGDDDNEEETVVKIKGRKYKNKQVKSVMVCITEFDAFLISSVCNQCSGVRNENNGFLKDFTYERIALCDLKKIVRKPTFDKLKQLGV